MTASWACADGRGAGMATHTATLVRMNRWMILAGYALLTACTQLLWLAYAPITTQTHHAMGVSSGAVGDLAIIFPLMYVILALPAGRWLDARFGQALGLGAILTAGGGLLRLAGPSSYGWALAGQFVIAAGQPFVLNSITKVAARYFPARGRALLLWVQAAVAVLAAVWVLAAVRAPAAFPGDPSVAVSLRWLRGDRFMWVLAGLLFVGMGVFNAVATWLDSILTHFGHGGASGYLIAIMTVGGSAGGALLPGIVARRDQRRRMLEIAVVVTAVAFAVMTVVHSPAVGGVVLFVAGFFLLAGLPVVLDWSELHAGPERAGGAAGFLLLAGNLGGVILALIVQAVIGNPYLSLGALALAGLAGLALATRLPAHGTGAGTAAGTGHDAGTAQDPGAAQDAGA